MTEHYLHDAKRHSHGKGDRSNFDDLHVLVYVSRMKRRELEKALRRAGWTLLRHGRRHDIWTDGEREEAIPRHVEINENLARVILRKVKRKS